MIRFELSIDGRLFLRTSEWPMIERTAAKARGLGHNVTVSTRVCPGDTVGDAELADADAAAHRVSERPR